MRICSLNADLLSLTDEAMRLTGEMLNVIGEVLKLVVETLSLIVHSRRLIAKVLSLIVDSLRLIIETQRGNAHARNINVYNVLGSAWAPMPLSLIVAAPPVGVGERDEVMGGVRPRERATVATSVTLRRGWRSGRFLGTGFLESLAQLVGQRLKANAV